MSGSVQPKDVPITFIDRNPTIGTKFKNVIMSAFGYGNKLSRTAHIGTEALPAKPIQPAHITIDEPEEVKEYEAGRFWNANLLSSIENRRTRRLPPAKKESN